MSVSSRALSRSLQALLGTRLGVIVVLGAALVGTTGVGFAGALTTGLIYACVNNSSGTIKVVSATTTCANNEILLVWNGDGTQGPAGPTGPTGATGPAGTFGGVFTSPNGLCSISVTDSGITFAGPSCPIQIDASNLQVRSATNIGLQSGGNTTIASGTSTTVSSGGNTTVSGGGTTVINGAAVRLGGTSGCSPVARLGDTVSVTGSAPAGAVVGTGPIITGSAMVTAC